MHAKDGIKAKGFTLIELLIVVIIVAILAAIVVPQFTDSSTEAKEAALDANLAAMRSAVELYKVQHNGNYPGATASNPGTTGPTCGGTKGSGALGTAKAVEEQLTMATDANGFACSVAGPDYKYGPYIKSKIPKDPFKQAATVYVQGDTVTGEEGGWIFHTTQGSVKANVTGYSTR